MNTPPITAARGCRVGLLGLFLLAALACSPQPGEVELLEIPAPDLSAAEQTVRQQIGDQRQAIATLLEDAGASAEDRATAFGELGQIYLTYDFLDAAEASFQNASRLQPEDFRWIYLIGYLNQIQGRLDEAAERLQRALELQDDYLPAWLRLGRAQLESGAVAAAETSFERALQLDDTAAAAHEGLGKIAESRGELEAAARHFERALELQPQASGLRYALGQLYRRLGDLERARAELAESGDVAIGIQDPLLSPLGQLAASAQFYIMRAGEAMEVEDYPTAAAAYRQALDLDPTYVAAYKGLAYSLEQQGDLEGAIEQLRHGLEQGRHDDPEQQRLDRAELHRILGGLQVLAGRDVEAIAEFERAIELHPGDENARLKLANAFARGGEFERAVEHYDRILEQRPELAAVRLRRATALINLRRVDEALQDFERAVADAPEDPQLRMRYAEALDFLGRPDEARQQRGQAAELAREGSARARALTDEGLRQVREGAYEAAIASFEAALAESPEAQDARFQLASVLGHLGRYDRAVDVFRQLIEANPRHQGARHGEITSLLLARRYGEARVRLNEAMQVFPRDLQLAHTQARMMATVPDARVRDGRLALAVAQKLFEFKSDDFRIRQTLAMALAEAGQLDQAVQLQRQILAVAEGQGATQVLPSLRAQLQAYESGRAWTFERPEELLAATMSSPAPGR